MTKLPILVLALALLTSPCVGATTCDVADYQEVSQAELLRDREAFQGKKVQVTGSFLFSGSDFCYQIRKTKINTRDYFCFPATTSALRSERRVSSVCTSRKTTTKSTSC
jgi:hypothetical protein